MCHIRWAVNLAHAVRPRVASLVFSLLLFLFLFFSFSHPLGMVISGHQLRGFPLPAWLWPAPPLARIRAPAGPTVMLRGGVSMPSVGLGSSGGCHPDVDGSESTCANYNATLEVGLYLRASREASNS